MYVDQDPTAFIQIRQYNQVRLGPRRAWGPAGLGFGLAGRRQLIERALTGRLVGAPPQEPRGVPEAAALEVVERHLAHQPAVQRDPFGLLPRPPAGAARRAAVPERVPALVRAQSLQQGSPLGGPE